MDLERRQHLTLCALAIATAALPAPLRAKQQKASRQPNRADFQSGDFLWPKKEGAFIPYASESGSNRAVDAARWTAARDAYVETMEAASNKTDLDRERLIKLKKMTYTEFRALYANAAVEGTPTQNAAGLFNHVGHVAIIDIDDSGIPWIIESIVRRGTVRQTYDEWIQQRRDDLVWHGRIKGFSAADRSKISAEATKHLGKPYKFWNFDMLDDSGFYCSKLAWMSTFKALDLAIDGKRNSRRLLWVSPKQLLNRGSVDKLHSPGSYTTA